MRLEKAIQFIAGLKPEQATSLRGRKCPGAISLDRYRLNCGPRRITPVRCQQFGYIVRNLNRHLHIADLHLWAGLHEFHSSARIERPARTL